MVVPKPREKPKIKVAMPLAYDGFEAGSKSEEYFWDIVQLAYETTGYMPLVSVCWQTDEKGLADAFWKNPKQSQISTIETSGIDSGFNFIELWRHLIRYGELSDNDRIVLLAGDVNKVPNKEKFLEKVREFILMDSKPFIMADFKSESDYSGKRLVGWAVQHLVAHWHPQAFKFCVNSWEIFNLRSEYINCTTSLLKSLLLKYRKFPDQTLASLLRLWYLGQSEQIDTFNLGIVEDEPFSHTNYNSSIFQVHRANLMLQEIFNDLRGKTNSVQSNERFEVLSRRAEDICRSERDFLLSLLGESVNDLEQIQESMPVQTGNGSAIELLNSTTL